MDAEILAIDVTQTVFLKYSLLKGMFIDSKSVNCCIPMVCIKTK